MSMRAGGGCDSAGVRACGENCAVEGDLQVGKGRNALKRVLRMSALFDSTSRCSLSRCSRNR